MIDDSKKFLNEEKEIYFPLYFCDLKIVNKAQSPVLKISHSSIHDGYVIIDKFYKPISRIFHEEQKIFKEE